MFLFVVIVLFVSDVSVSVLLMFRMGLQSLEGLVLYEVVLRRCIHVVCLLSVCMRFMISNVTY